MPILAATSSTADIVMRQPWGWLGARQARAGPILVATAVCCLRWLGMFTTYGMGGAPPPPGPPVPQESDCQAVSVPSFLAPLFTLEKAEGRQPATSSSASRSSITRTGLPPAFFETCAV